MNNVLGHVMLTPGDVNLGAKHLIAAVDLRLGTAAHGGQVAASLGFGQVHGAGPLATDQFFKISGFELVGASRQQRFNGTIGEQRAQGKAHVGRILHLATGCTNQFGQALATEINRVLQPLPATGGKLGKGLLKARCGCDHAIFPARWVLVALPIQRTQHTLRELGCLTTGIDPAWEAVLVDVFRSLGRYRDHSHLALFLQPQLLEAGGPVVCFTEVDGGLDDPGATVRDSNFQDVLLGLIGFLQREVHGQAHNKAATSQTLKKTLSLRLEKLHTGALRDGKKFLVLDEVQQHRVRKRLKRLRYLMEFTAPLFSARKVHQMTVALKPAQDAMGLYNDELMALLAWRALAHSNPDACFGVGWFAARRLPNARRCLKDIKAFADLKPFWRK